MHAGQTLVGMLAHRLVKVNWQVQMGIAAPEGALATRRPPTPPALLARSPLHGSLLLQRILGSVGAIVYAGAIRAVLR